MTWWTIWFAMIAGLFSSYYLLGNQAGGSGSLPPNPAFLAVGAMQIFASAVVRWGVLPRFNEAAKAFPVFVVGLALAEGACFAGLFLTPAYKQELFIASVQIGRAHV